MDTDVKSCVLVNGQYSKEFWVGVGVHQGSVLSPLLFILVLEALSRQFRTGVPLELLYADNLAVMADSLEECICKVEGMERGHGTQGTESHHEEDKAHGLGTGA